MIRDAKAGHSWSHLIFHTGRQQMPAQPNWQQIGRRWCEIQYTRSELPLFSFALATLGPINSPDILIITDSGHCLSRITCDAIETRHLLIALLLSSNALTPLRFTVLFIRWILTSSSRPRIYCILLICFQFLRDRMLHRS